MPAEVWLLLGCMAALAGACVVAGLAPPTLFEQRQLDEAEDHLDELERLWDAQQAVVEIDATVVALRVLVEVLYQVGPSRVATARGIFTEITGLTVTVCDPGSWTTWVLARSMVLEVRPCAA